MGTPDFALASLKQLHENSKHEVIAITTKQDSKSSRGQKINESLVSIYAKENNIKLYKPEKVKNNSEYINEIKNLNPDVIVVVAYGKILPKEILQIPTFGCINVHGSLLPKYRGAAPIQHAIYNGETEVGVTTMYMDEGMDTGDMLLKESIKITENNYFEDIYNSLKEIGAKLLVKTLDDLENIKREKQDDNFTIAPMITKEMYVLDFNKSAKDILNQIRAFTGCKFNINGNTYKVFKAKIDDNNYEDKNVKEIVYIDKNTLCIKCIDKAISILEIQPQNSKKMDIKAFLNSGKIKLGDKCD